MSFGTGYNFTPDTKARATEVNQNFTWFRGHYLPITVSNTWINTNAVYDIGSSSFQWRDIHFSGTMPSGTISLERIGATGSVTLTDRTPQTTTAYVTSVAPGFGTGVNYIFGGTVRNVASVPGSSAHEGTFNGTNIDGDFVVTQGLGNYDDDTYGASLGTGGTFYALGRNTAAVTSTLVFGWVAIGR